MAGAAYAALLSLTNILEQIQNHPRLSLSFYKGQIQSIHETLYFLQCFLEESHGSSSSEETDEDLETEIASAAHAAEDVIQSHIVDQILEANGSTAKSSISLLDLQKVIQKMDSVQEKVRQVNEERRFKEESHSTYGSITTSSSPLFTAGKSTMVGFDDYLSQLIGMLHGGQSNRVVIPITGMGGIGKTTLAKNAYENLAVRQHFDICAWATVSQEYSRRHIFVELLSCLEVPSGGETDDELGEKLYTSLKHRRYLVILDDIWSIEVWYKIKFFLPNNNNGSRIVLTTRLSDVGSHFDFPILKMNFLDEDSSWRLFCKSTFGQESCPPELEQMGKKIVKNCNGLPLSIVCIGGLLGKSYKTEEYWESIANDINSILIQEVQSFDILSLSYSQLPVHLKPCFLYMGIFPKNHMIDASQLIKLWVAEGFLKQNKALSLEEVAEGYLKDLVDRNLILVHKWSRNGKIKYFAIHDLLRELCLNLARKENFMNVVRVLDVPQHLDRDRRMLIHQAIPKEKSHPGVLHDLKSTPLVPLGPLEDYFQQVNLRFIDLEVGDPSTFSGYLPPSICLLWSLETLIIRGFPGCITAPSEIWEMPQLRHVVSDQIWLPDPPPSDIILQNLHTLETILNFKLTEEVCKRIPNIEKLGIVYAKSQQEYPTISDYSLHNLCLLRKLKSLSCNFEGVQIFPDLENLILTSTLRELSVTSCYLNWEDLTMIGRLPQLEVLVLGWGSVVGSEWSPFEGEFGRLKYLKIANCYDFIYWNADSSHFPVLESLVLKNLRYLHEVPSDIGEIPTLRSIRLVNCSESAAISAMRILEEQKGWGNEHIQLEVKFGTEKKAERFRKKLQELGLTSKNLHLQMQTGEHDRRV